MEASDAVRQFGGAILSAIDHIQAEGLVAPEVEAKICLALHAAVEREMGRTSLHHATEGFLGELRERVHACLMCGEAHLHQAGLPPLEWVSEGDE